MPTPESWKIEPTLGVGGLTAARNAVYYVLTPKSVGALKSHIFTQPVILPYLDQASISYAHNWSEADNLTKTLSESAGQYIGVGQLFSKGLQYVSSAAAAGPHASTASMYSDSAPVTLNVRSKIFSADGDGSLLRFLDNIRAEGFGSLSGTGGRTRIGGLSLAGGLMRHPDWWDVKVVSVNQGLYTEIINITDMIIMSTNFTFYAPFVTGPSGISEPMLVDIDIGFKQTFRGFRESHSIGPQ